MRRTLRYTGRRFKVSGPHYADGWWSVDDSAAINLELTRKWFNRRARAREYANRRNKRTTA